MNPNKIFGTTLISDNVTNLSSQAINQLFEHGEGYESEKGEVKMLPRVSLILTDPTQRSLNIPGRVSNIFQLVAETLWVFSGSGRVTGFLSEFLPRASLYSDDGTNWRGAYGDRIFKPNENGVSKIEDIAKMIAKSPVTRQAHVSIFNSERDLPQGLLKEGIDYPKDVPCNVSMNFWVMPNTNILHLEVVQRSGDIFWGTGSINLFEFSTVHEAVLVAVNKILRDENKPELRLGSYRQNVTNLHYYVNNIGEQAKIINDNYNEGLCESDIKDRGCLKFESIPQLTSICSSFIGYIEDLFKTDPAGNYVVLSNSIFENVMKIEPDTENTLYVYLKLIEQYILFKRYGYTAPNFNKELFEHHPALLQAVESCKFTKFSF